MGREAPAAGEIRPRKRPRRPQHIVWSPSCYQNSDASHALASGSPRSITRLIYEAEMLWILEEQREPATCALANGAAGQVLAATNAAIRRRGESAANRAVKPGSLESSLRARTASSVRPSARGLSSVGVCQAMQYRLHSERVVVRSPLQHVSTARAVDRNQVPRSQPLRKREPTAYVVFDDGVHRLEHAHANRCKFGASGAATGVWDSNGVNPRPRCWKRRR